jgi:hypothetical protein
VSGYLDITEYKKYSTLPSVDIDYVETEQAGWIDRKLDSVSRFIDLRLRKRYTVPLSSPYPKSVCDFLARMVDPVVLRKRGVDATDQQYQDIVADAQLAREELKEAADSEDGLIDLPVDDTADASAISKGTPRGYSEASPYVAGDVQEELGREEDRAGEGSGDV